MPSTRRECEPVGPTLLKSPYWCGWGFAVYLAVGGLVLCASMGMLLMFVVLCLLGMARERGKYCRPSYLSSIQYKNLNDLNYRFIQMTIITYRFTKMT